MQGRQDNVGNRTGSSQGRPSSFSSRLIAPLKADIIVNIHAKPLSSKEKKIN